MSFTVAYSELIRLDDDLEPTRDNPRILDIDGFEEVPDDVDIAESTFKKIQVVADEDDHTEYPKRTWKVLKGFKSWKPKDSFGLDMIRTSTSS